MTVVSEAAVDDGVAAAFDTLGERMRTRGAPFEALAASMRRAGAGGKRLRPRLVVRAFRAAGGNASPCVLPVAVAFELLHTAFVIHDDVIDGDTVRRGIPNVSGEFRSRAVREGADPAGSAALGDAAAILAGDLLLHEAQRMLARLDLDLGVRERLLDIFDEAVLASAAGELADVEHDVLPVIPQLGDSLLASRDKTAVYTFSAPLRAGATLAGCDAATDEALARCGAQLGLAFQLVDDLIGAFGDAEQTGRDAGTDLVAARRTPLVAVAHDTGAWPEVSGAIAVAHTGPIALRSAQRALAASGARDRIEQLVAGLLADARAEPQLDSRLACLVDDLAGAIEERMP